MNDRRDADYDDDLLEQAINAVMSDPFPDEPPSDQVAKLVAKVRQTADQTCPVTILERFKNMKATTKIAVAATALSALFGLISWLVPGSGTALAFADVAEALNNIHSASWKTTTVTKLTLPGEKEERTVTTDAKCMFLAPASERTESTFEGQTVSIQIVDGQKGKAITLAPATKTATVVKLKDFPPENSPFGRTFQGLRELVVNAQSGKAGTVERLGSKTIDDHAAEGFHIQVGAMDVKIWADAKTLLPIRVEQSTTKAAEGPKFNILMTDFEVNVRLDESLFAVDVPTGYTVQQTRDLDASNPWEFVTGTLKLAAEYNDGVFPPTLQGEQGIVAVIQQGAQTLAEKHKGSPDELRKLSTDVAENVAGFLGFLYATPPDALHYAGKDVKLGTANRPILWMERKRDGRCMVIYADLTVQEASKAEMPKLPESNESPEPK